MRSIDRLLGIISNDKYFRLSLFIFIIFVTSSFFLIRILILHRGYEELVHGYDFCVYYNAAKAFLNNADVYAYQTMQDIGSYIYPPLAIVFFIPFAYLNFDQAFLLMCLLNLFSVFVISFLILKILNHYSISHISFWEKSLLPFAIFAFTPVNESFYWGQINIIILLLVTLFYYFFIKNRKLYANLSLLLATIIKVFPVILIIFSFFKGKKKFVATFLAMLSISLFISILIFGIPSHIRFIEILTEFQRARATYCNISLSSTFLRFIEFFNTPHQELFLIIFNILKIFLVILILYYVHTISFNKRYYSSNEYEILVFSLMITLVLVFSNMVWNHYGTFLVLPYILCIYVLNLNSVEKLLISTSIILFSLFQLFAPPGVNMILTLTGLDNFELYYTYLNTLSPLSYAPLLFLCFILYKLSRGKSGVEINQN